MPKERLVLAGVAVDLPADHRRRARPHPDDRRQADRRAQQPPDGRRRRARHRARHRAVHIGDGRRDGPDRRRNCRQGGRTPRTRVPNPAPGSAASAAGPFLCSLRPERGLDQAAGPRRLDRAAEALLHQRHHPAHVLHRASAGFGDDRADRRLASASLICCGRKRSITAISASSAAARSSRPFLR